MKFLKFLLVLQVQNHFLMSLPDTSMTFPPQRTALKKNKLDMGQQNMRWLLGNWAIIKKMKEVFYFYGSPFGSTNLNKRQRLVLTTCKSIVITILMGPPRQPEASDLSDMHEISHERHSPIYRFQIYRFEVLLWVAKRVEEIKFIFPFGIEEARTRSFCRHFVLRQKRGVWLYIFHLKI